MGTGRTSGPTLRGKHYLKGKTLPLAGPDVHPDLKLPLIIRFATDSDWGTNGHPFLDLQFHDDLFDRTSGPTLGVKWTDRPKGPN